jgi:hypothetical protein
VFLPLYLAGIVGPALGSGIAAAAGPGGPFIAGGAVFLVGAVFIVLRRGRSAGREPVRSAGREPVPLAGDERPTVR